MNPITETRYGLVRYVVLWGIFAAAYSAVYGLVAAIPAEAVALDGTVFWIVSGFEGLILWNVLRYGAESIGIAPLKSVYRIATGILFVAVAVGAECLVMLAPTGTLSAAFTTTIPARCLTTAAVYVCFALWYSSAVRSDKERPERILADAGSEKPAEKQVAGTHEPLQRITVRGTNGKIEVIEIGRIVYIRAEGDYVAIVTPEGRWLKEGTMKWFEESLPRGRFVRVHRSYIVSVGNISRIETSGRDRTLVMRPGAGGIGPRVGEAIRMSDTGYRLLKRTLGL